MPLSATTVETKIHDEIRGVLSRFSSIHLAIVFGSVAGGHARPDSDLDLAVLGKTPLSANQKIELIAALVQQVGRPIDLVDLYEGPQPLLGQVIRDGRRILGTDSAFAALITRNLLDQADFVPLQNRILAERREAWLSL
jgi:predicted nucleotidyltransferase